MSWKKCFLLLGILSITAFAGSAAVASAQTSSSTNYQVNEYYFGSGGELNACSTNYCSKQSLGEAAVGEINSTNYQAHGGFNTTSEPLLEIAVNGSVSLGILDSGITHKGTASIQVRSYLSTGYLLQITGAAPTSGAHTLASPASPTASTAGTEQFGINLRQNTIPAVGTDPVQYPDSSFSFGVPMANYNIPNSFMYQSGASIAQSTKSTGRTDYTLSVIANVAPNTPAGSYTTNLSAVVVATF